MENLKVCSKCGGPLNWWIRSGGRRPGSGLITCVSCGYTKKETLCIITIRDVCDLGIEWPCEYGTCKGCYGVTCDDRRRTLEEWAMCPSVRMERVVDTSLFWKGLDILFPIRHLFTEKYKKDCTKEYRKKVEKKKEEYERKLRNYMVAHYLLYNNRFNL